MHKGIAEYADILIGIDDTDNADSRGTGFHSRQLAHKLEGVAGAEVKGISRHQLFVNSAIRYTSQNSSACILLKSDNHPLVKDVCEQYLKEHSAPGSDAGLCIALPENINDIIIDWGKRAKCEVLEMKEAFAIARESSIFLQGYTGTHEGIIGALAAVGLRFGGQDGRFIWRKGKKELRDMQEGIFAVEDLMKELDLDGIRSLKGESPSVGEKIYINEWVRPILTNNETILIAEKIDNHDEYEWKLATKEVVRANS